MINYYYGIKNYCRTNNKKILDNKGKWDIPIALLEILLNTAFKFCNFCIILFKKILHYKDFILNSYKKNLLKALKIIFKSILLLSSRVLHFISKNL